MSLKFVFQLGLDLSERQRASVSLFNKLISKGHSAFFYSLGSLSLENDGVFALVTQSSEPIDSFDGNNNAIKTNLNEFDVIFIRQNPPLDSRYMQSLDILSYLSKPICLNSINALRSFSEKLSIFHFSEFILPTIVTENPKVALDFFLKQGDVMIKPVSDCYGRRILRSTDQMMFMSAFDTLKSLYNSQVIVQKYSEVIDDKRVLFIDGKWCYPLARLHLAKDTRTLSEYSDLTKFVKCELTEEESCLCSKIGAKLCESDVFIAIADLIDGKLLEVNITSPECIFAFSEAYNISMSSIFVDLIEKKIWNQ